MYLSRLFLNPRSRDVRRDLSDCQDMHRTVLRCFPTASGPARQEHEILYRLETTVARPQLLVQSRTAPDWKAPRPRPESCEAAGRARPLRLLPSGSTEFL